MYVVQCADSSLYTGVTTNLPRRLAQHQAGTGAKYTAGRGPFTVRLLERYATRSAALKREAAIKALDRAAKMVLIAVASRQERTTTAATRCPGAEAGRRNNKRNLEL